MAAGLGYIEFTTGDILTAASANGYLASQTVMVFASAAARTSAIASPQEGMVSYLKDTDAVEKYNGSAWVAIATAGSSGALTLITNQSFSAASAVNVNDVFSSTYTNYKVVMNVVGTAGVNSTLRWRVGGADNSTSNYNSQALYSANPPTGQVLTGQNVAYIGDTYVADNFQEWTIASPFASKPTSALFSSVVNTSGQIQLRSVYFTASTSFTGFSITPGSGTITGNVRVYGIGD